MGIACIKKIKGRDKMEEIELIQRLDRIDMEISLIKSYLKFYGVIIPIISIVMGILLGKVI